MTDQKPLATAGELAAMLGAELIGPPGVGIYNVAGIEEASPGEMTFIRSERYARMWASSHASAAVVTRGIEVPNHDPQTRALLLVENADRAMIALLQAAAARVARPSPPPGVHPSAVVDPLAEVAPSASIGACAVVGAGAKIGERVVVGPHSFVDEGVVIGEGTTLHIHVVLLHGTRIGRGCELHSGAVIGSDGFGYVPGPEGPLKVPHLGGVTIADEVEIGANTAIDRGKFTDSTVGERTKIDNLVQLGHSCRIGRGVIICGCCAIGGSVFIGDGAVLGGHLSIRDNLSIEAGAQIGGGSLIHNSISSDEPWFGVPARPVSVSRRMYATMPKIADMRTELRNLSRRVDLLEGPGG